MTHERPFTYGTRAPEHAVQVGVFVHAVHEAVIPEQATQLGETQ